MAGPDLDRLRSSRENRLSLIMMMVASFLWLALVIATLGVGLLWALVVAAAIHTGQAVLIAHLRGEGVKLGPDQYPDLYQKVVDASARLGLARPPEAFLLNERGVLNAFATRFAGRNFIVLYTEIVEACEDHPGAVEFVIGHELGHVALGHLRWMPFLFPARVIPLLGSAYSRACEYSCDRAGRHVSRDLDGALRGLAVLASGGRLAAQLNLQAFASQSRELGRFWPAVIELNRSHPYTPKRVAALALGSDRVAVRVPGRNPFAYVMAPFMGVSLATGGGASVLLVIAIVGILAAIAVPNYIRYQERSAGAQSAGVPEGFEGVNALEEAADPEQDLEALRRELEAVWGDLPPDPEPYEAAAE